MCYDKKPPTPMPLIEVAGMLARSNKGMCASAVRDAIARITALEQKVESLKAERDAALIDCAKMMLERDAARAEAEELRAIIEAYVANGEALQRLDELAYAPTDEYDRAGDVQRCSQNRVDELVDKWLAARGAK